MHTGPAVLVFVAAVTYHINQHHGGICNVRTPVAPRARGFRLTRRTIDREVFLFLRKYRLQDGNGRLSDMPAYQYNPGRIFAVLLIVCRDAEMFFLDCNTFLFLHILMGNSARLPKAIFDLTNL